MKNNKKVFAAVVPMALTFAAVGSMAAFAVSADGQNEIAPVVSENSGDISSVAVSNYEGIMTFKMAPDAANDIFEFLSIGGEISLDFFEFGGDTDPVFVNLIEEQCVPDLSVEYPEELQSDKIDLSNAIKISMPLISVKHSDESKFTPEQWADILEQIERGEIFWED